MEYQKIKKRFQRNKPNKKWTEKDIRTILDYLQAAPLIEAPTAQIFYKKLIEKSRIDATWELIRWKVRHLKDSYKKANDFRKSAGTGPLDSDADNSNVEGKVLQMCPYYKQLHKIFGDKYHNVDFVGIENEEDENTKDSIVKITEPMMESLLVDTVESMHAADGFDSTLHADNFLDVQIGKSSPPTQESDNFIYKSSTNLRKKSSDFAKELKKISPNSLASHLASFQAERTQLFKIRLEWEREMHEKEMELSHKKLKLEEDKIKREMDLKVLQLEKDERLKILEIEKEERVQKFEIEMKYKFPSP